MLCKANSSSGVMCYWCVVQEGIVFRSCESQVGQKLLPQVVVSSKKEQCVLTHTFALQVSKQGNHTCLQQLNRFDSCIRISLSTTREIRKGREDLINCYLNLREFAGRHADPRTSVGTW